MGGTTKNAISATVKSAERVIEIFEYFERVKAPRTLSEISQDLDYPTSSSLALLRSMQMMGYLTFDPEEKAYVPSIRLAVLGQWMHSRLFEGGAVVQMMKHLAVLTEETVLLSVQSGLHAEHVYIVQAFQPLQYTPSVGTLRPLLRSAAGRVLLAQQSDATVSKTVERINKLGIDDCRTFEVKDVLKDLRLVRKSGYSFSANVFTPGAAILSTPLPAESGELPMVLSVGGPSSRIDKSAAPRLLQEVQRATAEFFPGL